MMWNLTIIQFRGVMYILLNEGLIEILNDETTYNIIVAREKKFSKLEEILC